LTYQETAKYEDRPVGCSVIGNLVYFNQYATGQECVDEHPTTCSLPDCASNPYCICFGTTLAPTPVPTAATTTTATPNSYFLEASGECMKPIETSAECATAAASLGSSFQVYTNQNVPRYCYSNGIGAVYFNENDRALEQCSSVSPAYSCVCIFDAPRASDFEVLESGTCTGAVASSSQGLCSPSALSSSAECSAAVAARGYSASAAAASASEVSSSATPAGCYVHQGQAYYNSDQASAAACAPDFACLCDFTYAYSLTLSDSVASGWQGNALHGLGPQAYTLAAGASGSFTACLTEGRYTPYVCGGADASETSWQLSDSSGGAAGSGAFQAGYVDDDFADCSNAKLFDDVVVLGHAPSPQPSYSHAPSPAPSAYASKVPSALPFPQPTFEPTSTPTKTPTFAPVLAPSPQPSSPPTLKPSAAPTAKPTPHPTPWFTALPTDQSTPAPTLQPTKEPSATPTAEPSPSPSQSHNPTPPPSPPPTTADTVGVLLTLGVSAGRKSDVTHDGVTGSLAFTLQTLGVTSSMIRNVAITFSTRRHSRRHSRRRLLTLAEQAEVSFEVVASLGGLGFASAGSLQASVVATLEQSVGDGSLTAALALACGGCAIEGGSVVSSGLAANYPTLSPTQLPAPSPTKPPSVSPAAASPPVAPTPNTGTTPINTDDDRTGPSGASAALLGGVGAAAFVLLGIGFIAVKKSKCGSEGKGRMGRGSLDDDGGNIMMTSFGDIERPSDLASSAGGESVASSNSNHYLGSNHYLDSDDNATTTRAASARAPRLGVFSFNRAPSGGGGGGSCAAAAARESEVDIIQPQQEAAEEEEEEAAAAGVLRAKLSSSRPHEKRAGANQSTAEAAAAVAVRDDDQGDLAEHMRRFLARAKLGAFTNAFVQFGLSSVRDLCDASLISDAELVSGTIGMDKVQVRTFRKLIAEQVQAHAALAASAANISSGGDDDSGDGSGGESDDGGVQGHEKQQGGEAGMGRLNARWVDQHSRTAGKADTAETSFSAAAAAAAAAGETEAAAAAASAAAALRTKALEARDRRTKAAGQGGMYTGSGCGKAAGEEGRNLESGRESSSDDDGAKSGSEKGRNERRSRSRSRSPGRNKSGSSRSRSGNSSSESGSSGSSGSSSSEDELESGGGGGGNGRGGGRRPQASSRGVGAKQKKLYPSRPPTQAEQRLSARPPPKASGKSSSPAVPSPVSRKAPAGPPPLSARKEQAGGPPSPPGSTL